MSGVLRREAGLIRRYWREFLASFLVILLAALAADAIITRGDLGNERADRLADQERASLVNCEAGNRLRTSLRGTLQRGKDFREREGTLTPAGAAFFDDEIAALADIDCRALVPGEEAP